MKKILFVLSLVLILLAACQPKPNPDEAVLSSTEAVGAGEPAAQAQPTAISQAEIATPTASPTETPVPTAEPTLPPPTPTLSPEALAGSITDLVGTWKGRWSDTTSIYQEFTEDGTYRVFFPNGDEISSGRFSFEGGQIRYESVKGAAADRCVQNPSAIYEVYVTKRGDQSVKLRFVLASEENCVDRKDFLDGKTHTRVEP